jgi:hypothetical protein
MTPKTSRSRRARKQRRQSVVPTLSDAFKLGVQARLLHKPYEAVPSEFRRYPALVTAWQDGWKSAREERGDPDT